MPEFQGLRSSREVTIANPGKLTLAGLPPGKYQLCRQVTNHLGEIGVGAMLDRQFFEVKAGATKSINYVREKGSRVRGRIIGPEGTKLMGIVVSIADFKTTKNPFDDHDWGLKCVSQTAAADGTFLTEKVLPGKYQLVAVAYTPPPEQRFRTGIVLPPYRAEMAIEVKEEGELVLPDLTLTLIQPDSPG